MVVAIARDWLRDLTAHACGNFVGIAPYLNAISVKLDEHDRIHVVEFRKIECKEDEASCAELPAAALVNQFEIDE